MKGGRADDEIDRCVVLRPNDVSLWNVNYVAFLLCKYL